MGYPEAHLARGATPRVALVLAYAEGDRRLRRGRRPSASLAVPVVYIQEWRGIFFNLPKLLLLLLVKLGEHVILLLLFSNFTLLDQLT